MAKQQGKMTREQKIAAAKAAGVKKAKEVTPPKPKGAKPDFTPRAAHAALDRLIHARKSGELDASVQGVSGQYFIGIHNGKEVIKAFDFTVKLLNDGLTVIEGYDGIYIPLDYIFEPTVSTIEKFMRHLAPGYVGNVQFQMVSFLQEALAPEIVIEKEVRRVKALNLRKAKELSQEIALAAPTFSLATVDGMAVKPNQKTICSLSELAPGAFGRYNFNDVSGHHCLVDYYPRHDGKTVFEIHSMNQEHELAVTTGVRVGLKLRGENLAEDKPVPATVMRSITEEHYNHLVATRAFFIARLALAHAKAAKVA